MFSNYEAPPATHDRVPPRRDPGPNVCKRRFGIVDLAVQTWFSPKWFPQMVSPQIAL